MVSIDGGRLVGLITVVSKFKSFGGFIEGEPSQCSPDSQLALEVHAIL